MMNAPATAAILEFVTDEGQRSPVDPTAYARVVEYGYDNSLTNVYVAGRWKATRGSQINAGHTTLNAVGFDVFADAKGCI